LAISSLSRDISSIGGPSIVHPCDGGRLADRQSQMIPAEDPDYGYLGQAFPLWPAPARQAILQPPRPEIQPSERILERVLERDLDIEAAD